MHLQLVSPTDLVSADLRRFKQLRLGDRRDLGEAAAYKPGPLKQTMQTDPVSAKHQIPVLPDAATLARYHGP